LPFDSAGAAAAGKALPTTTGSNSSAQTSLSRHDACNKFIPSTGNFAAPRLARSRN
jgi:hypothetical protein